MSALGIAIARLMAVAPVTAIVTSGRIYAVVASQGTPAPYVVVNIVSEPDEQMLAGPGGYFDARVSIECIGASALQASTLGEAVKQIDLTKGTVGAFSGVDIAKADSDHSDASEDRTRFRRVIDFSIRWRS